MESYVGKINGDYVKDINNFFPLWNLSDSLSEAYIPKDTHELRILKRILKNYDGKLLEIKTEEVELPEQKYYLHIDGFINDEDRFINKIEEKRLSLDNSFQNDTCQTEFTQKEIDDMNNDFNFDLNDIKVPVEDEDD